MLPPISHTLTPVWSIGWVEGAMFWISAGASAVVGTVVGSFADKYGRRKFAILYCLIYFGHCATKHWNIFNVLMLGRVLGGISTSLLGAAQRAWKQTEALYNLPFMPSAAALGVRPKRATLRS